ncbi:hypothetical protein [Streptomyces sp. NPDC013489]|uniref:hypothetical protein n=1 Tax=Streptomyces sp. NPDC013489 TaxID=3155606 RepID=UPI0034033C4B
MAEPDIPSLIADLKTTVVQGHIRQILEHSAVVGDLSNIKDSLAHLKEKIEEIHIEVVKHKTTEMLEMLGLDKAAAIHEKFQEAKLDNEVAWWDWLTAGLLGIIPLILVPALAIFFKGQIIDWFRQRQSGGDEDKPIWTSNGNGGLHKEPLKAIKAREDRKWNGGTSLADLPATANFDGLRDQLTTLIPHLEKFNSEAPKFTAEFRKLPKDDDLRRAEAAIKKVTDVVALANPEKITALAKALGKLTGAVKHHDPKKIPDPKKLDKLNTAMVGADPAKIREVASATGKLASAQRHFDPKKLPKAGGLASAARSAERLADAGRDVAQAFNTLRLAAQRTAAEI